MARRKRSHRRRASAAPRRPRRRSRKRNPFAVSHQVRVVRRRRSSARRRHRNPPSFGRVRGMGGGLLKRAWQGLKDGAAVEVGRIVTNKVPTLIPVKNAAGLPLFASGLPGMAAGALVATFAGMAADKVVRGSGGYVTAGGFSLLIESLLAGGVASGVVPKALAGYVPLNGYVPLAGVTGVDHEHRDGEYTPVYA